MTRSPGIIFKLYRKCTPCGNHRIVSFVEKFVEEVGTARSPIHSPFRPFEKPTCFDAAASSRRTGHLFQRHHLVFRYRLYWPEKDTSGKGLKNRIDNLKEGCNGSHPRRGSELRNLFPFPLQSAKVFVRGARITLLLMRLEIPRVRHREAS